MKMGEKASYLSVYFCNDGNDITSYSIRCNRKGFVLVAGEESGRIVHIVIEI